MNLNEFIKIPFEDGLKNFTERWPILAASSEELSERYSKESVFGLIRATTETMTKSIQAMMGKALETGEATEKILAGIQARLKQNSRSYAETVFRTNLNTAFNAGRQRQAKEMPEFIVGFEFSATLDPNVRDNHKAFDGLRAPADHPVWKGATPPLGYNCRCTIRQITRPEAKRNGWLDKGGKLKPYHPRLGENFAIDDLPTVGAQADDKNFGSRAFADRWITIGAKGGAEDGKGKRKGKHIQIDEKGNIVNGGPPHWKGEHIGQIASKEKKKADHEDHSGAENKKAEKPVAPSPFATRQAGNSVLDPAAANAHENPKMKQAIEAQKKHADDKTHWGSKDGNIFYRPGPNPTVDNMIIRDGKNGKEILLIQRADKEGVAERGKWALPGGFHDTSVGKGEFWEPGKETAQDAALRELREETGLDVETLKKNMTHTGFYDKHGRDPRDNEEAWAVSNAFMLYLPPGLDSDKVKGMDDADNAKWVKMSDLENLDMAFDHKSIVDDAKIEHSVSITAKTKPTEEMRRR